MGEGVKYALLVLAMALAAGAETATPHQVFTGVFMLISGLLFAWFLHPATLDESYQHMTLTYKGQWALLKHLRWVKEGPSRPEGTVRCPS